MTVKNIWLSFFVLLSLTLNSQVTELWNVSPSGGLNQHGLIYKVNGDGSGFEELVSMDSLNADNLCSELTLSQGYVYGFAYQGASAFLYRVNTTTRSYEKVINLPTSISSSRHFSKLTGVNGRYYFISASGGSNSYGGVYAYDTTTQSILSLTNFSTQTGFYSIAETVSTKGRITGLLLADSSLYGVALLGGQFSKGTIYKYTPSTNHFDVVFNFGGNNSKAGYPMSDLIAIDNYSLLGFSSDTNSTSNLNATIIFSFYKSSNSLYEMRQLSNFDGAAVGGQIAYAPDGYVYASARYGGYYGCTPFAGYGCGTLIRFHPIDNTFEKLYDFQNVLTGPDAYESNNFYNPGVTLGYDGNIYSTAGILYNSYAYQFNISTKTLTKILDHVDSTMLANSGYFNFVNVTNGYLDINDESISNIDVKVYPNPATQVVNIELRTNEHLGNSTFEIFDLLGRRQYKSSSDEKLFQANVEGLTAGLYCWKYSTAKGTKTGKLLIATHD